MSPAVKSKAKKVLNVDNPQRLQGGHTQMKAMRDSDFSVDAIDIKKGIDRDLFTDSGYLKRVLLQHQREMLLIELTKQIQKL